MLMGSDDGGVDHRVFVVRIVSQRLEKTLPQGWQRKRVKKQDILVTKLFDAKRLRVLLFQL